jgi:uncharacterized protein (AIM24 family)
MRMSPRRFDRAPAAARVRMDIRDETVRAAAGALSNLRGDIRMTASLPTPGEVLRSLITHEARVRPRYEGAGSVALQPSLGGFHVLEVHEGVRWILEPGAYLASEGEVRPGLRRERFRPTLWAGDGLMTFQTTQTGRGRVAINAPGPVELAPIQQSELRVQGRPVLGRTDGLRLHSRRATSWLRSFIAGQRRLRVFRGTGLALVGWTPYRNQHMHQRVTGEDIRGSLFGLAAQTRNRPALRRVVLMKRKESDDAWRIALAVRNPPPDRHRALSVWRSLKYFCVWNEKGGPRAALFVCAADQQL